MAEGQNAERMQWTFPVTTGINLNEILITTQA